MVKALHAQYFQTGYRLALDPSNIKAQFQLCCSATVVHGAFFQFANINRDSTMSMRQSSI